MCLGQSHCSRNQAIGTEASKRGQARASLCLATVLFLFTGCGKLDLDAWLSEAPSKQLTSAEAEAKSLEPMDLKGHPAPDVRALLGVPQGKLETQEGLVWLYPDWRVQFDSDDRVVAVEREKPIKLDPRATATASAAGPIRPIVVLANGGSEVDLAAHMPVGKVVLVDFYADWCGPCRQISPHLERLATQDADIVLVKVDIVNWNTPVTRQYGIRSVPNIRVFDTRGNQVGAPTSSLTAVQQYVAQAKKS